MGPGQRTQLQWWLPRATGEALPRWVELPRMQGLGRGLEPRLLS